MQGLLKNRKNMKKTKFYPGKWMFFVLFGPVLILPQPANARRVKEVPSIAKRWHEDECKEISSRIAEDLGLTPSSLYNIDLRCGPTKYGREYWQQENDSYSPNVFCFIRIGYLFFLDETRYQELSDKLKREIGSNIIRVKDLNKSVLADIRFGDYTNTTIAAMFRSNLAGKRMIDAGAGEGVLSLVAYRLGAAFVELVEIKQDLLDKAKSNLELNGLIEGTDFQLIRGDLRNTEQIVKKLTATQQETAVISNIGHWPCYSASNTESIELLSYVFNVTLFIAGGYRDSEPIDRDMQYIMRYGFTVNNNMAIIGNVSLGQVVAWVAKKDGK